MKKLHRLFNPKGDRQALTQGDSARDERDWPSAAAYYRRYLKTKPNHFAIWVQLGHALKESNQYDEAEIAYNRALALNKYDSDLLLNLGHLNKIMGRHDLAIDFYYRSAGKNGNAHARHELESLGAPYPRPQGPEPLDGITTPPFIARTMARIKALASGKHKQILRGADKARDLRRWSEAADLYRLYLQRRPDHFAIWVQLGHALKESNRRGEAMVAYRRAMALNAQDTDLLLNIGHLYNVLGDRERSTDFYRRGAAVDGASPTRNEFNPATEPPDNQGQRLISRASAPWYTIRDAIRAVAQAGKGDRAALVAANAARDRRDWPEAAQHYRRYLQGRPHRFGIWVQLGHALKEAGMLFEAETAYGQAMLLNPRDADLLLSLGHLYKLEGDRDLAIDFYRHSFAEDGNEQARAELGALSADTARSGAPAVSIGIGDAATETLFDADYYLATYPDVATAGIDPYDHYVQNGVHENRSPNACFDTRYYLAQTADTPRDPTQHYLRKGAAAGLDPHPLFETGWYLATHEDVRAAGANPLQHYLDTGRRENRETAPRFRRTFGQLAGFSRDAAVNTYRGFTFSAPGRPVAGQLHDAYVVMASVSEPQRQAIVTALDAFSAPKPPEITLDLGASERAALPNVGLVFLSCFVQSAPRELSIDSAGVRLYFIEPAQVRVIRTYGPIAFAGRR